MRVKEQHKNLTIQMRWASYAIFGLTLWYLTTSLLHAYWGGSSGKHAFSALGGSRMLPTFADLRWITVTAECGAKLQDIYLKLIEPCDVFGRLGKYPPMSIWIARAIGINNNWTEILGLLTGLSFILVFYCSLKHIFRRRWLGAIVISILLVSFPVQFSLERSNLDLIIYMLMAMASTLISMEQKNLAWLSSGLLTLVTVSLKIYPIFGFLGWILFYPKSIISRDKSFNAKLYLSIAIGSVLGLCLSVPWIRGSGTPIGSGGLFSHGLMAFGYINNDMLERFGSNLGRWAIRIAIAIKLSTLALSYVFAARQMPFSILERHMNRLSPNPDNNFHLTYFIVSASTWLGSYVITISYDYRLLFMLPSLAYLTSIYSDHSLTLQKGQLIYLASMITSGVITILFPLLALRLQDPGWIMSVEMSTEFIFLPFYAGALAGLLINSSILTFLNKPLLASRP
jgi:hypothetical protein